MLTPPTQLHDAFFKSFMSKPELAGRFLREHLPSDVAELLSQEPPEQVPGSFVDEDFSRHHTDASRMTRCQPRGCGVRTSDAAATH
jgi:predicted transposase YdaD